MKIYFGHKKTIDYPSIYQALRNSELNNVHEIVLPHETSESPWNSKEDLKGCDVMIVEVSEQSLSLGIEVGWASSYGCRIIFVHKPDVRISNSWKHASSEFIEYSNTKDLLSQLKKTL